MSPSQMPTERASASLNNRAEQRMEQCQLAAAALRARLPEKPQVALILGSSLGPLSEILSSPLRIPYVEIPGMLRSTAPSHAGEYVFGYLNALPVLVMSGRFHSYEGYDFEDLALPIRILKLVGVEVLILTNAAGAVNTDYQVGDLMIIRDHILLTGHSPLRGPNLAEFGPRFCDSSEIYDATLRTLVHEVAIELNQRKLTRDGVYFFMPGPQFETPAEIRAIRILGGDAVGMSTVSEAIVANHCGMRVIGLSLMTNMAAGILAQKLSAEEVNETAEASLSRLKTLLKRLLERLGERLNP